MDDAVQLIKEKLDIVEYIGRSVTLKKSGRNFSGLCPFHTEHTPSFNVSPDRQIFKCFGCGVSGDLFTFVMQREGLSFADALKLLAGEAGVDLERSTGRSAEVKSLEEKYYSMHELSAEYYHFLLMKHDVGLEARQYFASRDFDISAYGELFEKFKLGYSPKSWDSLGTYLQKKGYSAAEIVGCGLGVQSENKRGFYDMFRGRVMFPLFDKTGRIVGFAGRVLGSEKTAKYINTAETSIFHKREFLYGFYQAKESIRRKAEVVLVEGEMDMLSSYKVGVKNVVAVKGSALTEEQIEMLKRLCSRLLLCFDSDFAGDAAMRKAIALAENKGLEVKVISLAAGKDPDECIRKNPKLWLDSISEALPYYDFLIQSAFKRFDSRDPYGKKNLLAELKPYLSSIKDFIIKSHYIQKMSTMLDMPEKQLDQYFISSSNQATSRFGSLAKPPQTVSPLRTRSTQDISLERVHRMERYMLALLLRLRRPVQGIAKKLQLEDIDDKSVALVYTLYVDFFQSHPDGTLEDFLQFTADKEVLPVIDDVFLIDVPFENDEELGKELFVTIRQLKELVLREKLRLLSLEIKQAEISGDSSLNLLKLQKEIQSLHERLGRLHRLD